jgi:hypothetical protein
MNSRQWFARLWRVITYVPARRAAPKHAFGWPDAGQARQRAFAVVHIDVCRQRDDRIG